MLRKLQLRNYRSCVDTTFELQPDLSVLIGPNGSGKTNILSGLVLLRRLLEQDQRHHLEHETPTGECVLKAWFEVEGKTAILTANIALYTDERNNDILVSSEQSWYAKDFVGNRALLKVPLNVALRISGLRPTEYRFYDDDILVFVDKTLGRIMRAPGFPRGEKTKPAVTAIGKIANWVNGITYYSASQFINLAACPVSIEVDSTGHRMPRARQRENTATRFLFDLYSAYKVGADSYKGFDGIIGPPGIHLIDKLSFNELPTSSVDYTVRVGGQARERRLEKLLVVPQFQIGKDTLSPNQLSLGTFKTIALLFYLLTENRTLLLLEEPEVCVHHGLLASILELVKTESSHQQIVISTHSDLVVDHVEPRSMYVVMRSEVGDTSVSSLTKSMSAKDLAALRDYLKSEGTLGEYWKHGAFE